MSENTSFPTGTCEEFRDELPLLAVGSLDPDRTALLKTHLERCATCRADFASHCRVLETVKKESEPGRPLDTERVLARLRQRIGEPAAGKKGGATQGRLLASWFIIGVVVLGLAALLIFAYPGTPPPKVVIPEPPDVASLYTTQSPGGRGVKVGTTVMAEDGSVRLRFGKVEVRLKKGGELRVKEDGIELLAGTIAVNVNTPKEASFEVSVPAASARVSTMEARFAVELSAQNTATVTVAEGEVILHYGAEWIAVAAGRQAAVDRSGLAGRPVEVDPKAAFRWLSEELYKGLKLELAAVGRARVSLRLRNTSEGPVSVTGYHPLGVNYQLELRRPGSTSPEFVKLDPSAMRLQRAPGVVESVRETMGQFVLDPGQLLELEMDLAPLLAAPGTYRVVAEYLGFGPSGGSAAELGLLLRSNEVLLVIVTNSPAKGAPK